MLDSTFYVLFIYLKLRINKSEMLCLYTQVRKNRHFCLLARNELNLERWAVTSLHKGRF